MPYDPKLHHRRSIRIRGYSYSSGAYFVTICTHKRMPIFGEICDGQMFPSDAGKIAEECCQHFAHYELGAKVLEYVVMPNHVHIVLVSGIAGQDEEGYIASPEFGKVRSGSLAAVVGSYKSMVSRRVNILRGASGATIWQRSYYEHVIRSEVQLNAICQYVIDNPARWAEDRENPQRVGNIKASSIWMV